MMMVRRLDDSGQAGEPENLEDANAVELLKQGRAVLFHSQKDPPSALLDLVRHQIEDRSPLGPVVDDPRAREKIDEALFKNGFRRNIVEGLELPWYASGSGLIQAVRSRLYQTGAHAADLYAQMDEALRYYRKIHTEHVTVSSHLNADELRRQCLVCDGAGNFLDNTRNCRRFSKPWFDFHEQLRDLDKALNQSIVTALEEGRILVSQATDGGDRLLGPTAAAKIKFWSSSTKAHFCFSADLPKPWFLGDDPLKRQRAEAVRWMVRVAAHFKGEGRRATRQDLILVATEKFRVSKNAASEAYQKIKGKLGVKLGNVKKSERVDINEIRAIE